MDAALQKILLKKAGALLARRGYSRGEMRNKLTRIAGASQVESVLDRLEQLNLLNDADYAYNFALCRIKQEGWGPGKVHDFLLRRHVAQATIESALERIRKELKEESILVEYIKKRCEKQGPPMDLKGIRKLVLHLRQRGFAEGDIFSALKGMVPAAVLHRFETGD